MKKKNPSQTKAPDVNLQAEVAEAMRALAPAVRRLKKALSTDYTKLNVGAVADLLYTLRTTTQLLNVITAPFDDILKPAIKAVEEYFVNTLEAGESSGVQGRFSRVQVTPHDIPVVNAAGWPKLYAYIKRTGSFELLNRAINREAVKERWAQKKQVPGVTVFHDKRVSCTKLGNK